MKTQPKLTTTSKYDKRRDVYCVCCHRPLSPRYLPIHHEGREKKEVPMCAKCHWALHYGSLEVRKRMRKIIQAWLKKTQK